MPSDQPEPLLLNCPDLHASHALRRLCSKVLLCTAVWGLGGVHSLVLAHDSGSRGSAGGSSGGAGGTGKGGSSAGSAGNGTNGTGGSNGTNGPGRGSGSAGGAEKSESSGASSGGNGNAGASPGSPSSGGGWGSGGNAGSTSSTPAPSATVRLRESDHDQARQAVESGQIQPLRSLMSRLEKEYPGEVMGVELERHDGSWIYEIKLLQPGGWLTKLKVDARTGVVLKQQGRRGLVSRDRDD